MGVQSMAHVLLSQKARKLRHNGASLNEIVSLLKVPKSTARYWCRDIRLSEKQLRRLNSKQLLGSVRAAEKIRQRRLDTISFLMKEGEQEIGSISERDLWIAGAALYWAEGYKKGNDEFGFTNSDPRLILLIIKWLVDICKVPKFEIRCRVCINSIHRKRIKKIQIFWSNILEIPLDQFTKSTLISVKNKKSYLNSENYFGTLRIKVRKGTNLRRKVMGWIEGIAKAGR